ncbi:hypothetical protein HYX01_04165 [Candidatus Woesearchaeota archaeon]|nr:hypothetical protein [Candidatus Woesearchaeota archaeon]
MKLTKGKLIETIRKKNQGWTTYQARKIAGISIRRVNQVYKQYLLTEQIPEIGKNNGRPAKPIEGWNIDRYYYAREQLWVFAVLDDASRKLLALAECKNATTEQSIYGMKLAMKHGKIKQCICDHGTQFIKQEGMESTFKDMI